MPSESHRATNVAAPAIAGLVAGAATVVIALLIPKPAARELLSALLFAIAGVYLGFALVDGRWREMLIEGAGLVLTLALAALGLWVAPVFLAAGYFVHGFWDVIHGPRGVQTEMPRWYVFLCSSYDWLIAVFILFWWR